MTRPNFNPAGRVETCDSWYIDAEPGDSTRYRLLVALAPDGTLLVHWLGGATVYTTTAYTGDYLKPIGARHRKGGGDEYDSDVIGAILDAHVRTDDGTVRV